MKKIFFTSLLFFISSAQLYTQWYSQNPAPTGNTLKKVSYINENNCVAVGLVGTVIKSTDGGNNWNIKETGTTHNLLGISFVDENNGTVVGVNGTILRTSDGGENWVNQSSGTTNTLNAVSFININDGIIVGDLGTILVTSDAGTSWIPILSGTEARLNDICFLNTNLGIAVGVKLNNGEGVILKTTNGGQEWVLNSSGTVQSYSAVAFADINTGIIVGPGGVILRTTDSGTIWHLQSSGTDRNLVAVDFIDLLNWSAASYADGGGGVILITTNGGIDWVEQILFWPDSPFGISYLDINNGIVVGQNGMIFKTTDGGSSWIKKSNNFSISMLYDIFFTGMNTGYAVGSSGKILKTIDGELWNEIDSGIDKDLNDVFFVDSAIGFVVGQAGTIRKTTDAGDTWNNQISGTTSYLNAVYFENLLNGFVIGGNGTILQTTNGGIGWELLDIGVSDYNLEGISFYDENVGVIVGSRFDITWNRYTSVVIKTTNGGDSWQTRSLSGDCLKDVFTIDSNKIVACGFNDWYGYGVVRVTNNGGGSWLWIQTDYPLHSLFFTDVNTGFAVGGQNPFISSIIKTTNGGIHWINQASSSHNWLTSVFFVDQNIGYAAGFNGTILKTNNGGNIPVELVSLTASLTNRFVHLNWSTASELNNQGFEIERSTTKNDWIKIGFKEGRGTTTEQQNYSYTDNVNGINVHKLFYRLKQIDFDGSYEYSDVVEVTVAPIKFSLSQNYPNPFNPSTKISWQSPVGSHQTLKVFDVLGREVATLVDEFRDAGMHEIEFQSVVGNRQLASGVYYYQLKVGEYVKTQKMILAK